MQPHDTRDAVSPSLQREARISSMERLQTTMLLPHTKSSGCIESSKPDFFCRFYEPVGLGKQDLFIFPFPCGSTGVSRIRKQT